ncbi:MAG: NAD-dependent epimerase/dehydratase family protein, partial [Nitrosopumilus sp.]|nr:NAD-dependent epimerase/dehydratase family protein [Nitrosopumilus sp.]
MEKKLQGIKKKVTECTKCELSVTRNNAVPGKGNYKSDVIFVGEAPGKNEDMKGEPFIGVAGNKLSAALESAGITRDQVYITNIVKCRPPKNRVPTTIERNTCQNYLKKEIEIIKPKIICILGNTAFNSLLDGKDITVYGDGSQTRSFQFIDDLVKGLIKMMKSEFVGPINLGN